MRLLIVQMEVRCLSFVDKETKGSYLFATWTKQIKRIKWTCRSMSTTKTGQPDQEIKDCKKRTGSRLARTGSPEQDCKNKTARNAQPDRTAKKELPGWDCQDRLPGQD
jgi:hypothetical protein